MKLLHISDPHFHSDSLSIYPHQIKQPLIDLINEEVSDKSNFYLLLTGDITIQGQKEGYEQAKHFFKDVITQTQINPKNIILCPGNHDIQKIEHFTGFDSFSYALRQDDTFTFSEENNRIYMTDHVCFIAINSSYRFDHKYGYIDINNLSDIIDINSSSISTKPTKIAITHHHFLNVLHDDTSVIRNGYQTVDALSDFNFIFHGHQHTRQKYDINNIQIKGISSPTESRSFSNVIAFYDIDNDNVLSIEEYTFSKDTMLSGKMGRFIKYG
jgi:3',5'-cyclic AMP phosphodiesterase CpdA